MEIKLKYLELFAGTQSVGRAFRERGHKVMTVDWQPIDGIDWCTNIRHLSSEEILQRFGKPDIIWASPDCTSYSVAALGTHRYKNYKGDLEPISDYAMYCDDVNVHVRRLIYELQPALWFIENPRGGMRKMWFMQDLPRYTVTYCQYGDNRMKPTDIWTNHPDPNFKPMCRNGDTCHVAAPRGSKTGTQGIQGNRNRGIIPEKLCNHVVDICESYFEAVDRGNS